MLSVYPKNLLKKEGGFLYFLTKTSLYITQTKTNKKMEISEYKKQALDFAKEYGVKMKVTFFKFAPYFSTDKQSRAIFKIRLSRENQSYTFTFGQSIADGMEEPTLYDVLATLEKYDVGSFEDFCSDFGYEQYTENNYGRMVINKEAKKTYKAVCKQYEAIERLFSDCMEELQEIN